MKWMNVKTTWIQARVITLCLWMVWNLKTFHEKFWRSFNFRHRAETKFLFLVFRTVKSAKENFGKISRWTEHCTPSARWSAVWKDKIWNKGSFFILSRTERDESGVKIVIFFFSTFCLKCWAVRNIKQKIRDESAKYNPCKWLLDRTIRRQTT